MAQILSPFACSLNVNRGRKEYDEIQEVTGRPAYRNSDITIWRKQKQHYQTCWKNIVITETTGAPKDLADAMASGVRPVAADGEYNRSGYHYDRMQQAIADGKRYAKERNFEIVNI